MRMANMTSDEFREAVKKDPIAILVLGATEAHGSHLPLNADTVQPEYIADEIGKRVDNILIVPPLNFALHSTTKNMPGTVNLTFDTLRAVIYDMLTSLHEQQVRRFIVMTGHAGGGHMTAISEACKRFVIETGDRVLFFADCDIGEHCPEMKDVKGDGHGGMAETSRVLAVDPDNVRPSRPIGKYAGRGCVVEADASIAFPMGIIGDTTKATAELGNKINDYIIGQILEMIENDL